MKPNSLPKVLMYDPAISSLNLGDHIISASCDHELRELLDQAFVVKVSSHLPASKYLSYLGETTYKFACGSNLLRGRMNARFRQWDITPRTAKYVRPVILMGVGWWQYGDDSNAYTRWLYHRILSAEMKHSVRDEYTATQMRAMGFENVINTACPTMWRLTEEHCRQIPVDKGTTVVTTVTDYRKDPARDRTLLMSLSHLYATVRIWVQGAHDLEYLNTLDLPWSRFDLIPPDIESFNDSLADREVDYVGTRLHAGIRALQLGRRSLIIGVDNRASEKARDFNLGVLNRENILGLEDVLGAPIETAIRIPEDAIAEWRAQFPEISHAAHSK